MFEFHFCSEIYLRVIKHTLRNYLTRSTSTLTQFNKVRDVKNTKHLLEIKRLVSEKNKTEKQIKLREPDLLIVLTGGEMAYTREDGVKIIPIGCLRD